MYSITGYGNMIADEGRYRAYRDAIESVITPGSVVLDIGTGPGVMAFLACRAGASRVYAVEPDDILEVAESCARVNRFDDRITFLRGLTTELTLPEKVDVIVYDLRGALPLFGTSLVSVIDARKRLLKPKGRLIAASDTLWAALVSSETQFSSFVKGWDLDTNLDFSPARKKSLNTWMRARILSSELCTAPVQWAHLDYLNVDHPNVDGRLEWSIDDSVVAHGVAMWFDCQTAPGASFSNSPLSPEPHIYRQGFFPWPRPTPLDVGDQASVRIRANFVRSDYCWTWETRIVGADGRLKEQYAQTTASSGIPGKSALRKRADHFVPVPTEASRIDLRILEQISMSTRLDEIANNLVKEFPQTFATWELALARVGDLSERYSA